MAKFVLTVEDVGDEVIFTGEFEPPVQNLSVRFRETDIGRRAEQFGLELMGVIRSEAPEIPEPEVEPC